jgi:hypothetical protein
MLYNGSEFVFQCRENLESVCCTPVSRACAVVDDTARNSYASTNRGAVAISQDALPESSRLIIHFFFDYLEIR